MLTINQDEGTEFMDLTPPIGCNASLSDFMDWANRFWGQEIGQQVPALYQQLAEPQPKCEQRTYDPVHHRPVSKIVPASHYRTAAMRAAGGGYVAMVSVMPVMHSKPLQPQPADRVMHSKH